MPQTSRYQPSTDLRTTSVECSHCHEIRHGETTGRYTSTDTAVMVNGELLSTWIRFLPARGRFHSWCRECERAHNRANRTARPSAARRVAGTYTNSSLGANRKFGIELELVFPRGVTRDRIDSALAAAGCMGFRARTDMSISCRDGIGWEIVSPPLQGETGLEQVRTATRVLRELGATANRSTGMHVHHDVNDLTADQLKNAVISYANNQDILDGLVAPSRRQQAQPTYCRRLSDGDLQTIRNCTTLEQLKRTGIQRYRTINIASFAKHGTLEFRQHQGTCDFEKIATWISLGQAIIDSSMDAPMSRKDRVTSLVRDLGCTINETAATFTIGRAVQFAAVAV